MCRNCSARAADLHCWRRRRACVCAGGHGARKEEGGTDARLAGGGGRGRGGGGSMATTPAALALARLGRRSRSTTVWFPDMYMTLISVKAWRNPPVAVFKIPPRMTKTQVKEYLTKIYGVPVVKVNTANFLGKWRRMQLGRRLVRWKNRDFKKAWVTLGYDKVPPLPDLTTDAKAKETEPILEQQRWAADKIIQGQHEARRERNARWIARRTQRQQEKALAKTRRREAREQGAAQAALEAEAEQRAIDDLFDDMDEGNDDLAAADHTEIDADNEKPLR